MPRLPDDFVPATALSNGHAQTFFAALRRRPARPPLTRRRFDTPDGDFIDVDVLEGAPGAPTVLLLHGLEGSSSSTYVSETLRLLAARRWNAWALNFRGCSGEPNRVAASYSSGDTRDLAFLVPQLKGPRFAIGFSLGASVVLNGLARLGVPLDAAVAVSAPFQLATSAKAIDAKGGFGPVYLNHFLPSLKRKALEAAPRFSSVLDAEAITAVKTIRDFDHHVTARVFGFSSAEDYYARCSTAAVLGDIRTPTLLITAEDDAIAPAASLPHDVNEHQALEVLRTKHGGHVGYASGSPFNPRWWAEHRAVEWLASR
jgi:predicted alpha/beta-fold hydrolase